MFRRINSVDIEIKITIPYAGPEDQGIVGESSSNLQSYTNIVNEARIQLGDFVEFTGIITSKFRNVVM